MQIRDVDRTAISEFSLEKAAGRHGVCRFLLRLPPDVCRDWLSRVGSVAAITTDPPEEKPLFFGTIERATLKTTPSGSSVAVEARSCAVSQMEPKRRRFFQKDGKKFGDILDAAKLDMGDCALEIDRDLKSMDCEPPILQNESNYDFIRRLARATGRKFWVIDTMEDSPVLSASFCVDKSAKKFDADKILDLKETNTVGGKRFELTSREYCALGRIASPPDGKGKFVVAKLSLKLENGRDAYRYVLEEFSEEGKPYEAPIEEAIVIPGKIADAADPDNLGRIRFAVDPAFAEDADDDRIWIPWLSPYVGTKAGMVFVPEKDDPAELVLWGGRVSARGAVRAIELPEEACEVANKYLGNNFTERIIWKDGALELRSGDNYILLTPDNIEIKLENASIFLDKDNMAAQAKDISLNANENLGAKVKNASIFLDKDNIGAKAKDISLNASGTASVGKKVELG